MPEFLDLLPPREALQLWMDQISPLGESENLPTAEAFGRVIAEQRLSPEALPAFTRSAMDGYALRAADSHGAGESLPVYLRLVGEVKMGEVPDFSLEAGECALINTGGMLPQGTDAVIMLEHSQSAGTEELELLRAVAAGENVIRAGEDLEEGQTLLPAGARLRAPEIGGLMAVGITQVDVMRRPRIGILSTGDEVIPPEQQPDLGQVRDVNSYSLASLVEGEGGEALRYGIFSDNKDSLYKSASEALQNCDALLISAGSSASARDLSADLINSLGEPGVLVHGINLRPGKPTILGLCDNKPVIGLPGNPVSALVVAWLFASPMLKRLLGEQAEFSTPLRRAKLVINLASQSGREDWVAVSLREEDGRLLAEPIFGQSNLIFTLVRADGLLCIPAESNGLAAGEEVHIQLLR